MMVKKSLFIKHLPIKALLLALLLAFLLTGVVQAVLLNHKLSGDNPLEGKVVNFTISPDGMYTIFVGDVIERGKIDLFSVTTTGNARVTLSNGIPADCVINNYFISPDSETVVYSTLSSAVENCGLFAVPIDGGESIELFPATPGFIMREIEITYDNENVIFILQQGNSPPQAMIHRVPIGGGDVELLSYLYEGLLTYQITPDSQNVIFWHRSTTGVDYLIRSDMEGNQETLRFGPNYISQFSISSDSIHIVYLEEISGKKEIFSIPIEGEMGDEEKLNDELFPGGEVFNFEITPDSQYVVYRAIQSVPDMVLLYRAAIDGTGLSINLTPWGMFVPGGNVETFKVTPNSQGVVYFGDFYANNRFELFSVPIRESVTSPYYLTEGMNPDGDVYQYQVTPNSLGVVFIAGGITAEVNELFFVFINGTGIRRLNVPLTDFGNVNSFKISPNSLGVVYCADQEENEVYNLYAIPTLRTAGVMPLQINPILILDGDVHHYDITPDNKGVVYTADQDVNDVIELFITYDYQVVFMPLVVK